MTNRKPPPAPPIRKPGGGPDGFRWHDELERLRDAHQPGEWIIAGDFDNVRAAERVKHRIVSGRVKVPGGLRGWDIVQEKYASAEGGVLDRSRLWVRWHGARKGAGRG